MASILLGEFTKSRQEATSNGHTKPRRTPVLVVAARWLGRHTPSWERARTSVMQWGAGGLLTWAAVTTDARLGAVVGAVCLLVLEAFGGGAEAQQ